MQIVEFLEQFYILPGGKLFVAEPWQREFLSALYERGEDGRRRHSLALLEVPKKTGKTTTAAAVALWELLAGPAEGEIVFVANSLDQATALSFTMLKKALGRNPEMAKRCKILTTSITNRQTGTTATVLPCSAASVAGRNPSLTLFDELWALPNEEVFWQLTETPARPDPLTLITTYPGYDYSSLLYRLHQQGVAGTDPRTLFFWRPGLRSSWITDQYLATQKARLPAHVYQRLHEALWTGGSNAAWTKDQVSACVDAALAPKAIGTPGRRHFCGVDVGLRRDRTAAGVVSWAANDRLELDDLSLWTPPKGGQVLVADIEAWIDYARQRFPNLKVSADPSLFEGTIQRSAGGIEEVRFTSELVRRLSMNLHELIAGKVLALFDHGALIEELLLVNVRSTSYGWRLDHESGQHDDCVMALGIACLAAMEARPGLKSVVGMYPGPSDLKTRRGRWRGAQMLAGPESRMRDM